MLCLVVLGVNGMIFCVVWNLILFVKWVEFSEEFVMDSIIILVYILVGEIVLLCLVY